MRTLLLGAAAVTGALLVLRHRRAVRAEQSLWDQAAVSPVARDLR